MKSRDKKSLLDEGYKIFKVQKYEPGQDPELDIAAKQDFLCQFFFKGSFIESDAGGGCLSGWIDLEGGHFVVYLPPEDSQAFTKTQRHFGGRAVGFSPSQKVAESEFQRWLGYLNHYYYNATKAQENSGGPPIAPFRNTIPERRKGMDANTVLRIKPTLTQYLREFDGYFGRITARQHLDTYVQGQLSDLRRKSVEPMADAAGIPPRNLQEFLGLYRWDESAMRDKLQQLVAGRHAHEHSVGILDETGFVKKGDQTACVQRQYCGVVGKTENCVVSVHLGYATPDFHTLLDGELYLPEETWHEDRDRCRAAGVPEHVVYRPKWQIGLEEIRRARANGIRLAWMTFDEGYGGKPPFLRALDEMGQNYVGEVPASFTAWTKPPAVLYREGGNDRLGRPRKFPRLKVKNNPPVEVRHIASYSPLFRREDWQTYHVKDGHKGPMVWKAKRIHVRLQDENGLPTRPHHLLVAYNVLELKKFKYFISNAPEKTPIETLLLVAFSRWKIERLFEDGKGELGMDHFEVRKFQSIRRHLILSCVSYLFLAEFYQQHRGEKPAPDGGTDSHRDQPPGADLDSWRPLFPHVRRVDRPTRVFAPNNAMSRATAAIAKQPCVVCAKSGCI